MDRSDTKEVICIMRYAIGPVHDWLYWLFGLPRDVLVAVNVYFVT